MIDLLYKDFVLLEKRFHDTQNIFNFFGTTLNSVSFRCIKSTVSNSFPALLNKKKTWLHYTRFSEPYGYSLTGKALV